MALTARAGALIALTARAGLCVASRRDRPSPLLPSIGVLADRGRAGLERGTGSKIGGTFSYPLNESIVKKEFATLGVDVDLANSSETPHGGGSQIDRYAPDCAICEHQNRFICQQKIPCVRSQHSVHLTFRRHRADSDVNAKANICP